MEKIKRQNFMTPFFRVGILCYQWFIRPLKRPSCRFYPSCSDYALEALSVHGPVKGLRQAVWRLLRCHPWSEGGFDPVIVHSKPPSISNQ